MTAPPLAGRDGQVLDLLLRVVAIGRHRGSFTAADVVRVAYRYLNHPRILEREAREQRRRADTAEQHARQLAQRIQELEQELARHRAAGDGELPPRKVVQLSRREYEVFSELCEGRQRQDIAAELGIHPATVSNHVSHAAGLIGADVARAAAMVNRGVVNIQPRSSKTRRAA